MCFTCVIKVLALLGDYESRKDLNYARVFAQVDKEPSDEIILNEEVSLDKLELSLITPSIEADSFNPEPVSKPTKRPRIEDIEDEDKRETAIVSKWPLLFLLLYNCRLSIKQVIMILVYSNIRYEQMLSIMQYTNLST